MSAALDRESEEISLLGLLAILLRRWRTVLTILVAVLVAAGLYLLLRPATYTARTTLVPAPSKDDGRSGLLALNAKLPSMLPGLGVGGNSSQRQLGIIAKSHALQDSIVARMKQAPITADQRERVPFILEKRTSIKPNTDGSIVVEVRAPDARLAALLAQQFPSVINQIASYLARQAAAQKELFLQSQLSWARDRLVNSEQQLMSFQTSRDVPEVVEQAKQTVEAAAELQRDILEREVMVRQLSRFSTPNNPTLQKAIADLEARRDQLRRITSSTTKDYSVFVPFRTSPELKLSTARLLREFSTEEQRYLALTASLAQAQIDANDNLSVISVLDAPAIPDRRSDARPLKVFVVAVVLGLFFGTLYAFGREYMDAARARSENDAFFTAWGQFKRDVTRRGPPPVSDGGNGRVRSARSTETTRSP
jgi:capsular polysaccharide biosynthesis protein